LRAEGPQRQGSSLSDAVLGVARAAYYDGEGSFVISLFQKSRSLTDSYTAERRAWILDAFAQQGEQAIGIDSNLTNRL
jgi:hypothetical protein